jgi:hypothetical protein
MLLNDSSALWTRSGREDSPIYNQKQAVFLYSIKVPLSDLAVYGQMKLFIKYVCVQLLRARCYLASTTPSTFYCFPSQLLSGTHRAGILKGCRKKARIKIAVIANRTETSGAEPNALLLNPDAPSNTIA